MSPGELVKVKNQTGVYRVHEVKGNEATVFGGSHRQWRTFLLESLRPATKKEAANYLRAEAGLLEAARGIKPARPIKGKRN